MFIGRTSRAHGICEGDWRLAFGNRQEDGQLQETRMWISRHVPQQEGSGQGASVTSEWTPTFLAFHYSDLLPRIIRLSSLGWVIPALI